MNRPSQNSAGGPAQRTTFALLVGFLSGMMLLLFAAGLRPGHTVFSNDGPLGAISVAALHPPSSFLALWHDVNWVGTNNGALGMGVSGLLLWLLGPFWFSKLFAPFALTFAGISAWFCLRRWRFNPWACATVGIAASLNADFFGTACWGVAGQVICFGLNYLALAALGSPSNPTSWPKVVLAGFAVGLGVIEGADIGALFSLVVAAYVVVQALAGEVPLAKRLGFAVSRLAVVAVSAGLIAAGALTALISTQVKGVVGMGQDEETKAQRWSEAVMYSIPKREALGILVPGLFGLRFDTANGGAYWGTAGSDPAWDAFLKTDRQGPPPGGGLRAGAGSNYAGWLILLGAAWAVAQSLRGNTSFFTRQQRILIWFWLAAALVSLLLLFGRFAPFYKLFYALPYASTIRNPAKFLHVVEWTLIILAGYGFHGLATLYLERATATTRGLMDQWKTWWKGVTGFDRKWIVGSWLVFGLAVLGWLIYASSRGRVEAYIAELTRLQMVQARQQFDAVGAMEAARQTVSFSLGQVGWALGFMAVSLGLITVIKSGYFAGRRSVIAGGLLCGTLALDLGWQDREWVRTWNWQEKYVQAGNNPVMELLRQRPYEQRVSQLPRWLPGVFRLDPRVANAEGMFQSVYGSEWTQHLFLFNNIQTLDIVQMPRRPVEYEAFEQSLQFDYSTNTLHHAPRRWQLTSARYLVGAAPLVDLLNQAFDPGKQRFKTRMLFEFYQDRQGGPILTRTNATGPFALIEFTGALPRAKLFTHWQVATPDPARVQNWVAQMRQRLPPSMTSAFELVSTNDLATLVQLASPDFDPEQTVLLAEPLPAAPPTNATPGTVQYVSYAPKHIVLKARADAPGVLLLNDKHDPGWQVFVDGAPAPLLRCNYLMRGVYLPQAGEHTVEFKFSRPLGPMFVSLSAMLVGVLLLAYVNLPRKAQSPANAR